MNEQQKYQKRNLLLFPPRDGRKRCCLRPDQQLSSDFRFIYPLVKRRTADRDHRNHGRCPDF